MEFKFERQLNQLLQAMRHTNKLLINPLLLQADILPGDFDDFCLEVERYIDGNCFKHHIAETFEENLEQYIDQHFGDANTCWQREILTMILKKYSALEVSELNEILKEANIGHIAAVELPERGKDDGKEIF